MKLPLNLQMENHILKMNHLVNFKAQSMLVVPLSGHTETTANGLVKSGPYRRFFVWGVGGGGE